jgi:hypothetical protein
MKTKVMIKKKSHVRKYSRKVKNKKVKCSRKVLRGGALLSAPSYKIRHSRNSRYSLQPHQSLKKPLVFKFNTPFEKK